MRSTLSFGSVREDEPYRKDCLSLKKLVAEGYWSIIAIILGIGIDTVEGVLFLPKDNKQARLLPFFAEVFPVGRSQVNVQSSSADPGTVQFSVV